MNETPDTRLTPTERRQYERAQRHRDHIRDAIIGDKDHPGLTDTVLADLIRRAREPARDAYTDNTGVGGNDISRPTEAVAIRDAGGDGDDHDTWQEPADHVRQAIQEIFGLLDLAHQAIQPMQRRRRYVYAIASTAAGRQSSLQGDCRACGRDVAGTPTDRLKSGYCPACHQAWMRASYPDRHQFEHHRRQQRAS